MSHQGETGGHQPDDWWGQLYGAPETGPPAPPASGGAGAETLDERYASALAALGTTAGDVAGDVGYDVEYGDRDDGVEYGGGDDVGHGALGYGGPDGGGHGAGGYGGDSGGHGGPDAGEYDGIGDDGGHVAGGYGGGDVGRGAGGYGGGDVGRGAGGYGDGGGVRRGAGGYGGEGAGDGPPPVAGAGRSEATGPAAAGNLPPAGVPPQDLLGGEPTLHLRRSGRRPEPATGPEPAEPPPEPERPGGFGGPRPSPQGPGSSPEPWWFTGARQPGTSGQGGGFQERRPSARPAGPEEAAGGASDAAPGPAASPPSAPSGRTGAPAVPAQRSAAPGLPPGWEAAEPPAPERGPAPAAGLSVTHIGDRPPTYEPEPTAWPEADPRDPADLVPDTVVDGARYGRLTVRAASVRGDSARFRGEPRREALLTARFGTGDEALLLIAVAAGVRGCEDAHRAARDACESIASSVGGTSARLSEDLRAGRRGSLKSGLHRLVGRCQSGLRARGEELGLPDGQYDAALRCLLLPADPACRSRLFFGAGDGGLLRLRDGEWYDLDPAVGDPTADPGGAPGTRFRFRAAVARPGDVLLLCGPGLAEPLRQVPELAERLALRWESGEPPGLAAFLADAQTRVKGYADDRTAVAVWDA